MSVDQPSVLLVEDEPAQREVLAYNLRPKGLTVQRAENGEEALLFVSEAPPDLIVLDWMMPKLSGIEVCRRLKMRAETRKIPIIMLSARSEEVDKVRGLETGADDYVVKPYSVAELMARVRSHLRACDPPAWAKHCGSTTSYSTRRCTGCRAPEPRSSLGPPNSGFYRHSWKSRAASGAARSFWTGCGAATSMLTHALSTFTSDASERHCARRAAQIRSAQCAERATLWVSLQFA